jgi:hypothetical protein
VWYFTLICNPPTGDLFRVDQDRSALVDGRLIVPFGSPVVDLDLVALIVDRRQKSVSRLTRFLTIDRLG